MEKHPTIQPANNSGELSLKELVVKVHEWRRYLLSKWIVILFAGIIGGLIGIVYAYSSKPIYKAELSFALEDDKSGSLGGAAGLASQFGFDLGGSGGGEFTGDNLIALMKSRSMIEKTLLTTVNVNGRNQTLTELYISFNQLRKGWENKGNLKDIYFLPNANRSGFTLQQDSLLGVFYNGIVKTNLSVDKVDKKLSIIDVTINSENELFSKLFVEVLAKTVSDFYIDTKTKKSVQNVSILQHQTDSIRRELNNAISGVASSIDATPNANPGRQILRATSQHRQIDVQVNQAILTELVKNLEISKVGLRRETPLIQIIDTPILPLDKTRISKLSSMTTGSVLFGFFTILFFIVRLSLKNILSFEES